MTLTDQGLLILGSGHALKVFNPTTGEVVNQMSLGHLGIKEIDGLNWDKHLQQLNVLDGAQSIWLEILQSCCPSLHRILTSTLIKPIEIVLDVVHDAIRYGHFHFLQVRQIVKIERELVETMARGAATVWYKRLVWVIDQRRD